MSSYNVFARFYDRLTDNVNYDAGSEFISGIFHRGDRLLELACGTGNLTQRLCEKGFDVTATDYSEEMLAVASSKCNASFLMADMRAFEFTEPFDGCVCFLDSINHLTSFDEWKACFACVANALKKNGTFVFDMNTVFKHRQRLANNTFIFDEDDFYLVWDNEDEGDDTVRILLDFFVYNGKSYDRYSEEFREVAFPADTVSAALEEYFKVEELLDAATMKKPQEATERIIFVCKRK